MKLNYINPRFASKTLGFQTVYELVGEKVEGSRFVLTYNEFTAAGHRVRFVADYPNASNPYPADWPDTLRALIADAWALAQDQDLPWVVFPELRTAISLSEVIFMTAETGGIARLRHYADPIKYREIAFGNQTENRAFLDGFGTLVQAINSIVIGKADAAVYIFSDKGLELKHGQGLLTTTPPTGIEGLTLEPPSWDLQSPHTGASDGQVVITEPVVAILPISRMNGQPAYSFTLPALPEIEYFPTSSSHAPAEILPWLYETLPPWALEFLRSGALGVTYARGFPGNGGKWRVGDKLIDHGATLSCIGGELITTSPMFTESMQSPLYDEDAMGVMLMTAIPADLPVDTLIAGLLPKIDDRMRHIARTGPAQLKRLAVLGHLQAAVDAAHELQSITSVVKE